MSWPQLAVIPVLSLLLLVHELGHFIVARLCGIRVEEFGFGLPPRIWGVKKGEVIYSVNWIPLGAFVKMTGENGENPGDPRSFGNQRKLARAAVLVAGPAMNLLAGALLFSASFMVGSPTPISMDVFVTRLSPESPAAAAGLQPGDRIAALDGRTVSVVGEFIDGTRANLGKELTVTVMRDGRPLDLKMTPRTKWPEGDGPLGVGLESRNIVSRIVNYQLGQALPLGFGQAWQAVRLTFSVPAMVVQGLLPADAARPTGPIGIYQITTDAADQIANNGWWYPLISITALISVGLAVANMLPFPALDGGRLLMVGIEAIRRRKISPEREGALHFAGLMVLITLMLLISYYDVSSPLPHIDWSIR